MEKDYILVTGASSGIGEEVAVSLSQKYNVVLCGRDIERLNSVKSLCSAGKHLIWQYDLSNIEHLEGDFSLFLKEKGILIPYFVHCAGYMKMCPVRMLNKDILTNTFNVNIISAALITKLLVGKNSNGAALKSVVFISSNISNFGAKAFSAYSASKAGLDGLMRSLAVELAPKIRVNSVLPGSVRTRMTEHMYQDQEMIDRMAATYPLGLGTVTDIKNAVCFLLSEEARWITGQQLVVDGGRTVNITG